MTARDASVSLFEYRCCHVVPGRLADAIERMRTSAYSGKKGAPCLFEQLGVPRPLAAWTTAVGAEHHLVYLMLWPSMDTRERWFAPLLDSAQWKATPLGSRLPRPKSFLIKSQVQPRRMASAEPGLGMGEGMASVYLTRVRISPSQIVSQHPSTFMLEGPSSIKFPE